MTQISFCIPEKRMFKSGFWVQNLLLNLCSCAVNSQILFCIKNGMKCYTNDIISFEFMCVFFEVQKKFCKEQNCFLTFIYLTTLLASLFVYFGERCHVANSLKELYRIVQKGVFHFGGHCQNLVFLVNMEGVNSIWKRKFKLYLYNCWIFQFYFLT